MNAEDLIQAYSGLDASEQRKFDKRYKSLLAFRHNLQCRGGCPPERTKSHP